MKDILILKLKEQIIGLVSNSVIVTQPPINMTAVKALISIIELYYARKNKAKPIAAYSTL